MAELSLNTKIAIPDHIIFTKLEDELVALNVDNGHYYGMDKVGSIMFEHLKEFNDLRKVHAFLLEEYDVASESLEQDLLAFVISLQEKGLLTVLD